MATQNHDANDFNQAEFEEFVTVREKLAALVGQDRWEITELGKEALRKARESESRYAVGTLALRQ